MKYYGITDRGIIRKQNQDTLSIAPIDSLNGVLLVVCDGMGGAKGGNIASRMSCDIFCRELLSLVDASNQLQDIAEHMKTAAEIANTEVFLRSEEDEACYGMGTTLVSAVVTPEGAAIINIGDSRAYHYSPRDGLFQISKDHSVVAEMVERGEITKEQARINPNRNLITRALGTAETVAADFFFVPVHEGDIILLCSDGLSNVIEDNEISCKLANCTETESCCQDFIQEALVRGAPDNVTVALLKL